MRIVGNEVENEALREFQTRVRKRLTGLELRFLLFGSKARGDDHSESDLDVLVVVPHDNVRTRDAVYAASADVLLTKHVLVSPKVRSRHAFRNMAKGETPFFRDVMRNAVAL